MKIIVRFVVIWIACGAFNYWAVTDRWSSEFAPELCEAFGKPVAEAAAVAGPLGLPVGISAFRTARLMKGKR